jgi:hypothetical protein
MVDMTSRFDDSNSQESKVWIKQTEFRALMEACGNLLWEMKNFTKNSVIEVPLTVSKKDDQSEYFSYFVDKGYLSEVLLHAREIVRLIERNAPLDATGNVDREHRVRGRDYRLTREFAAQPDWKLLWPAEPADVWNQEVSEEQ